MFSPELFIRKERDFVAFYPMMLFFAYSVPVIDRAKPVFSAEFGQTPTSTTPQRRFSTYPVVLAGFP